VIADSRGGELAMPYKPNLIEFHRNSLDGVRILLADDFAPWRLQLRSLLQSKTEWKIIFEASNGLEAVQKTVELNPDAVLLDIGMPGLNGIETARIIRQKCPKCRIIFVTANGDGEIRDAAMGTGASGYVAKADAAHELLGAIQTALRSPYTSSLAESR
jgi:DNA-binding NarL/FixJ family response regulator